jgi:hypothetical protein
MTIRLLLGDGQLSIGSEWANELADIVEADGTLPALSVAIRAIAAGTVAPNVKGKAEIEGFIQQYINDARQSTITEPDPPDVSPPLTLAELRDAGVVV